MSQIDLQSPVEPRLVGVWRSELSGTDLSDLSSIDPRFMEEITLSGDGTADLRMLSPEWDSLAYKSKPPFPITWETTQEGMLVLVLRK
jgi:hypothetical protein